MAILIDEDTNVLVQGITGSIGSFQTKIMEEYGTNVVAGVTPGKGGQEIEGIPVYDFVEDAVENHDIDASISFVPGRFTRDAAIEAMDAGVEFIVLTAEGVPSNDMMELINYANKKGARLLGPDTPGLISPGKSKLGVHPHQMVKPGKVGVMSRSGALSYEICKSLTENDVGQTTVVGIGGGPLWGSTTLDVLKLFNEDSETETIVIAGEVGGDMEQRAAEYISKNVDKEVVALIVGRAAPKGKQLGHAGAIVEGESGKAENKIAALKDAGAKIAKKPSEIAEIINNS